MSDVFWFVEIIDGPIIDCEDEAEARETWTICEYELGWLAIIHQVFPEKQS